MKKIGFAICLLPFAMSSVVRAVPVESLPGVADAEKPASPDLGVLRQIHLLNQVPEDQINEKTDPGFSLLRTLYDLDGPDFLTLRRLLGQASVRGTLNPSARCVLAGVISQRWDTFSLSGNLYLAGLRSANPDLRAKARRKLVGFIQPAHIPELIELLQTPGPNVLAYEILLEATGQRIDPTVKAWRAWWAKTKGKPDLVGYLLKDTKLKLLARPIKGFDQERLWYVPEGIGHAHTSYAKRSAREQELVARWNDWVNADVRPYVEEWSMAKPVLDRVTHQPDPRVNKLLEMLVGDPGYGDYASVVLAWRGSAGSLEAIRTASQTHPTVGRALALGSLGDRTALVDLLQIIDRHQMEPLSFDIMQDDARSLLNTLRTVGVVPAERAFELLCHRSFDFDAAATAKEKKKAFKKAKTWLTENAPHLTLDRRRGYYVVPTSRHTPQP